MAGKRRKKQPTRRPSGRPTAPPTPSPLADAGSAPGTGTASVERAVATPVARTATPSRYAGSVTAPRRGAAATSNSGTIDIDERVPYFASDLRRIVITAVLMVIAIIGASFLLH